MKTTELAGGIDVERWRREFPIVETCTYLVSHSLGAMPRKAADYLQEFADTWGSRGVRAWYEGWWEIGRETGNLLAPILGVARDSITMHQNATVAKWYKEHGRHEVFARGKEVELTDASHNLVLNEIDLQRPNKPEMEGPKTAAEEMQMMRKLYNQMVMDKNQIKGENLIQIGGIKKKADEKEMAMAE